MGQKVKPSLLGSFCHYDFWEAYYICQRNEYVCPLKAVAFRCYRGPKMTTPLRKMSSVNFSGWGNIKFSI